MSESNLKVCVVVINSVWYDPRVRKQIIEYAKNNLDVFCLGVECARYNEEEIGKIPCRTKIISFPEKYRGKLRHIHQKLCREWHKYRAIRRAILDVRPDVIHANDFSALVLVYRIAKKLKCKLVYDSHEVYIETTPDMVQRLGFMRRFIMKCEQYMIRNIEQMVCVSHAAADYFASTYKVKKPMVVTNCGLRSEMPTVVVVKNAGFEILNHGQFYGGRGYDIMVEAANMLQGYPEIKMALRGFGRMEQQLRNRVEELKLENVIFYPGVKVAELIPEAAKSKVGLAITEPICLNFKLSVSNKLFEYAAAGLPVIMSDIPEHRYLNDKFQFGIVIPQNTPEELVKAVLKLYGDEAFYESCRCNAQKMSEEMNWENEFSKLIRAEKKMMEKSK